MRLARFFPGRIEGVWTERRAVALLSLAVCWLFFLEYLPPVREVHFYSDIEGYHYPLLNYTFHSLKEGRLPEWDASIYCGISFAGNIQAALFYPPNWLMYAACWRRSGLPFMAVQCLLLAHFWWSYSLAFCWLRARPAGRVAALLGAAAFAFSGYILADLQHLGVVCAYTWFPLGFWGLEEAAKRGSWVPLWKLAAASALCFLAGYPSTWIVFAVCVLVYAACLAPRKRLVPAALGALAFSFALSAVQLLPALVSASLKTHEAVYGRGMPGASTYASYFLPGFFDQRLGLPPGPAEEEYLYLGAPAIFALLWCLRRNLWRATAPAWAVLGASLLLMFDPGGWIARLLARSPTLAEVVHEWNFLAGPCVAAALLTAVCLDDFLKRPARVRAAWACAALALIPVSWSARQLAVWRQGGGFATGWAGAWELAVTLSAFALALSLWRSLKSAWLLAVLLAAVFVDAKVYGTRRRFNAMPGNADRNMRADARLGGDWFMGLPPEAYPRLRAVPQFRVAVPDGPHPTDLRFYGLSSPQGFDPFLPAQFKREVEGVTRFLTNRLFALDPANTGAMRHFGVGHAISMTGSAAEKALAASPEWRRVSVQGYYYSLYELRGALPAYRFPSGEAAVLEWLPERREFRVRSTEGGALVLLEQRFPGWKAWVDGRESDIAPYSHAFQQVAVPPGEHRVRFLYRAQGMRTGAAISAAAVLLLGLAAVARRR